MSTLKNPVTASDHTQGSEDAPCTLVEYGDYECPHCATAVDVVEQVKKHFGDQLRFVFRNFPLTQIHPEAEPAAESAEFAAASGKYWEMHDLLFENQDRLSSELYDELATQLELDSNHLNEALSNRSYLKHIRDDFSGGVRSGVNGTPTFFINGERHNGPFDPAHLIAAIKSAISGEKPA